MSSNKNTNEENYRLGMPLDVAALMLSIPYSVISQRSRRKKLGLVDAIRPDYCSDFRRRFVTLESVKQVQRNREIMLANINKK